MFEFLKGSDKKSKEEEKRIRGEMMDNHMDMVILSDKVEALARNRKAALDSVRARVDKAPSAVPPADLPVAEKVADFNVSEGHEAEPVSELNFEDLEYEIYKLLEFKSVHSAKPFKIGEGDIQIIKTNDQEFKVSVLVTVGEINARADMLFRVDGGNVTSETYNFGLGNTDEQKQAIEDSIGPAIREIDAARNLLPLITGINFNSTDASKSLVVTDKGLELRPKDESKDKVLAPAAAPAVPRNVAPSVVTPPAAKEILMPAAAPAPSPGGPDRWRAEAPGATPPPLLAPIEVDPDTAGGRGAAGGGVPPEGGPDRREPRRERMTRALRERSDELSTGLRTRKIIWITALSTIFLLVGYSAYKMGSSGGKETPVAVAAAEEKKKEEAPAPVKINEVSAGDTRETTPGIAFEVPRTWGARPMGESTVRPKMPPGTIFYEDGAWKRIGPSGEKELISRPSARPETISSQGTPRTDSREIESVESSSLDPWVKIWEMRHPGQRASQADMKGFGEMRAEGVPIEKYALFQHEVKNRVELGLHDYIGDSPSVTGEWDSWKEYGAKELLAMPDSSAGGGQGMAIRNYLRALQGKAMAIDVSIAPLERPGGKSESAEDFAMRLEALLLAHEIGAR